MLTPTRRAREVALPSRSLAALRTALLEEAGPLASIHALHAAGYEAGQAIFDSFAGWLGGPPDRLGEREFWNRVGDFLQNRGWGTLRHARPHGGVGLLTSGDWAEAEDASEESQPSCSFSAGMLSGFLSKAARDPVAVLQITCRGRGDEECGFAFGSESTVHDLYGLMLEDMEFERALEEL